jgi:uncharacterized protein (TIGR03067 family)
MRRALPFVFAILVLVPEMDIQAKPSSDLDKLKGTWLPSSAMFDGAAAPPEVLKDRAWVIAGNQLAEMNNGRRERKATLVVDAAKEPATLDVAYSEGEAKGLTGRGIWKLEGDTLTVCLAVSGDRPTQFATKRGDGLALLVFQRAK